MAHASPEPTLSLNNVDAGTNEAGMDNRPLVRKHIIWFNHLDHTQIKLSEEAKVIAGTI